MAANPKHIEGIYNYCDRWCERCSFTSRCAVYKSEQDLSTEETDINNKAFWDKIASSFADAKTLMKKAAGERGITLPNADDEAMNLYMVNIKKKRQEMELHPLIKYSKQYMIEASEVLQNNEVLKNRGDALIQLVTLGIKDLHETKNEVIELIEYLEIVQWYLFQIRVKFMRALPAFDDTDDDAFKTESNGSAKVGLIAADRCIAAWQHIMQLLPETQDDIIPLLASLQKIQMLGEHTFPYARAFVRVGLDE